MLENLPVYIPVTFGLTTLSILFLFHRMLAISKSLYTKKYLTTITVGLIVWLIIQALLTLKDVYNSDTDLFPPRILLFGILPPLLIIIILFLTEKGKQFIDSLSLINITYLRYCQNSSWNCAVLAFSEQDCSWANDIRRKKFWYYCRYISSNGHILLDSQKEKKS